MTQIKCVSLPDHNINPFMSKHSMLQITFTHISHVDIYHIKTMLYRYYMFDSICTGLLKVKDTGGRLLNFIIFLSSFVVSINSYFYQKLIVFYYLPSSHQFMPIILVNNRKLIANNNLTNMCLSTSYYFQKYSISFLLSAITFYLFLLLISDLPPGKTLIFMFFV